MSNISQTPSFDLSKTPPKLNNKQVLFKNNNKPTKRSGKSRYNKNITSNCNTTEISSTFSHNHHNNKPLKVVHISNPMRFQATAAEFRALVQGLTGRDAVVVDDDDHHHFSGTHQTAAAAAAAAAESDGDGGHHHGCDNKNNNSNDDDGKVLLHHHHDQQEHHHQQGVNLSSCFGPSDHLWFDYFGAFNGDLVVMEDLQASMGYDSYYY